MNTDCYEYVNSTYGKDFSVGCIVKDCRGFHSVVIEPRAGWAYVAVKINGKKLYYHPDDLTVVKQ